MKLAFLTYIIRRCAPRPMTVSQEGIQARAEDLLVRRGSITAWDILMLGTTDCHKMLTRMRRKGLLYPADEANGFRWQANRKGYGRHKVHYWTRKLPISVRVRGLERRKTERGGKA